MKPEKNPEPVKGKKAEIQFNIIAVMKNMEFERQNAFEFRNPIRRNLFEGF